MELGVIFAAWLSVMTAFGVSDARINEMKAQIQTVQVRVAGVQEENAALKNKVASLEIRLANEKDVKNALAGENDFLKNQNEFLWQSLQAERAERQALESELGNYKTWQKEAVTELQANRETILAQADRIAGQELLIARGLESAKKVNELRAENGTLGGLYSLALAERDDALSREKTLVEQVKIANDSVRRSDELYQETSETAEQLGTIVVFGGLVALIIVVILTFAVVTQGLRLREARTDSKNDRDAFVQSKDYYMDELEEAKEVRDDAIKTLGIVIAERDKLRKRADEAEKVEPTEAV